MCVCVCVCLCGCACVCVCVRVGEGGGEQILKNHSEINEKSRMHTNVIRISTKKTSKKYPKINFESLKNPPKIHPQ